MIVWLRRIGLASAVGALAAAVYLSIAHLTSPEVLACSESGTINCSAVTTSAQSTFLGIPVAYLGVLWSLPMIALLLPAAWASTDRRVHQARLVLAGLGIAFILWLIYAELFIIGAICLWCTVVHVCAFIVFATTVAASPERAALDRD